MVEHLLEDLAAAQPVFFDFLEGEKPVFAVILGSGLGSYAQSLEDARFLSFKDVPGMRVSTASGHAGRFVLGRTSGGQLVLCMQGRLHAYEGYTAAEVAFPVWLMHACGIEVLLATNAAGAVNPSYCVGDFCLVCDHVNLTGGNPLVGTEPNKMAERFVALNDCYDPDLRSILKSIASSCAIRLQEGVYLALLGPSFETPAEISLFRRWGIDTVAMSMVEEVIAARHAGMRVAAMSLISNMAAGIEGAVPTDEEILEVGQKRAEDFQSLLDRFASSFA